MRVLLFLSSSFISAFGDMLLICAIPAGLAVDTNDIRMAIFMWFIPAIAMYLSSYFYKKISLRTHHARRDYALLLLGIAIIEIVAAILAFSLDAPLYTIIISCIFVFFYAFAKEGIPRIFYDVQIYRFFVSDDNYAKLAGWHNALGILAKVVGGLLAGYLILKGTWKSAFIVDALTFIVFGLAILFAGKDAVEKTKENDSLTSRSLSQKKSSQKDYAFLLKSINIVMPLLFGLNALGWNYMVLILKKLSIAEVSDGIFIMTLLQIPGLLIGANFDWIKKVVSIKHLILTIPLLFFSSVVLFFIDPRIEIYFISVFLSGMVYGLLWPAERYIKSQMENKEMIYFNSLVLKRLSLFQFLSCVCAFGIYSLEEFRTPVIAASTTMAIVIFLTRNYKFQLKKTAIVTTFSLFIMLISGCHQNNADITNVSLPSVSRDLRIQNSLTYAGMAIVNDTSARLARVNKKLAMEGEILKSYQSFDNDKRYIFTLRDDYISAKGEHLDVYDLLFTIKWYLVHNRDMAMQLHYIKGAKDCKSMNCDLKGAKVVTAHIIEITLNQTDRFFVDKFASPWIILLKKNRPTVETIGNCRLPYQTGIAQITKCNQEMIELDYQGKTLRLYKANNLPTTKNKTTAQLLTEHPNGEKYSSLTVMTAFANPDSKNFNRKQRVAIMSNIRELSQNLAKELKLNHSPTVAPRWLSTHVSDKIINIKKRNVNCPKNPIKILLDTSLPGHSILKKHLSTAAKCPIVFNITNADHYFDNFKKNDIGIAWFTPDFLTVYNIFTIFDCNSKTCYFNWNDLKMQSLISQIKSSVEQGNENINLGTNIEAHILENGYASPIADMNWWIKKDDRIESIHQAGLFQVRISDFL